MGHQRDGKKIRKRFVFSGIVQGVGFRPAVFRSAVAAGVTGFVQNRTSVVTAEAEGTSEAVETFESLFRKNLPGAARIDSLEIHDIPSRGDREFKIVESEETEFLFPPIPPDLALCDACRKELLDPENPRHRYPFITCTQCGPRYSIVRETPFDRDNTAMREFPQCPDCLEEYRNPEDRRFHSQTNSCSLCGPSYRLSEARKTGPPSPEEAKLRDAIPRAIEALIRGKILAVHGIGGFHLAADPRCGDAVDRLRRAKGRERKPFALMAKNIDVIKRLCLVHPAAEELLCSSESPVCILERVPYSPPAQKTEDHLSTVSDTGTLGFMLPYAPVHELLFHYPGIEIPYDYLIMTSGNDKDAPIITDPEVAMRKLQSTADLFLYHNRQILQHCDDSIFRFFQGADTEARHRPSQAPPHVMLRRSRGFVPRIFEIEGMAPEKTLAMGGDLKNAPAFAGDGVVYLAPHIGDLANPEALRIFEKTIRDILDMYDLQPEKIVCDLHPGYHSGSHTGKYSAPVIRIQHHHAHILSVMAEQGIEEALGAGCDGTGYGPDGTIWGCEFLHAARTGFTRLGTLYPFRLPGSEEAVRNPRRTAYSILRETADPRQAAGYAGLDPKGREADILAHMLSKKINSPEATSAGRLFDAVSAILRIIDENTYEGEGPIKLEQAAIRYIRTRTESDITSADPQEMKISSPDNLPHEYKNLQGNHTIRFVLDHREVLRHLADSMRPDNIEKQAYNFHISFARGITAGLVRASEMTGIKTVCLSGGVFQNLLLRDLVISGLIEAELSPLVNKLVPPGDGGIALGQVYSLQI